MTHIYRLLLIVFLAVACMFSAGVSAMAQTLDSLPVNTSKLRNPKEISQTLEPISNDGSKQFMVAFTDTKTANRFEVYALHLENIDYAKRLFGAMEETLDQKNSKFKVKEKQSQSTIRLDNETDRTIERTIYNYTESDGVIKLEQITFTSGSMAILIMGYYGIENEKEGSQTLMKIVSSMYDNTAE